MESDLTALPDGATVLHLTATSVFTGDLVGTGQAEEEHYVRPDGTRDFAGVIIVTGTLGGRTGSFVIRTTGTFDGVAARSDWRIVPRSGTGGLRGIRGSGTDVALVPRHRTFATRCATGSAPGWGCPDRPGTPPPW